VKNKKLNPKISKSLVNEIFTILEFGILNKIGI